jgi:hypothetical protein
VIENKIRKVWAYITRKLTESNQSALAGALLLGREIAKLLFVG